MTEEEKSRFYFSTFKGTLLSFELGPHSFILHLALQIM